MKWYLRFMPLRFRFWYFKRQLIRILDNINMRPDERVLLVQELAKRLGVEMD
jgi:hypothetical protein